MPDPSAPARSGLTADMLIAALPGGGPPRGSKLDGAIWQDAARIFADRHERITLRELRVECGISHKTAWRLRGTLRDAAEVIREQRRKGRVSPSSTL